MKLAPDIQPNDLVFFMHIPKTAGTTLRSTLDRCFDKEDILPDCLQEKFVQYSPKEIEQYKFIRGHFRYSLLKSKVDARPHLITIVRDPVEQYISFFEQWKRKTDLLRKNHTDLADEIDFFESNNLQSFLKQPTPILEKVFTNNQSKHLAHRQGINYTLEESKYNQIILKDAKELISDSTCIGSLERLQESYYLISYFLAIPPIEDQTRLNTAPDRLRQESLTQESLNQIREYVKMDLEVYEQAQLVIDKNLEQMFSELVRNYGDNKAKLPLNHHQTMALLQRHYEKNYHKKHQKVPSIEFKTSNAVYHENWYRTGSDPKFGDYRWTGPGLTSRLDLPVEIGDSPLKITIYALRTQRLELIKTTKLYAFHKDVPLSISNEKDRFKMVGIYHPEPSDKTKPFLTLKIALEETIWTKNRDRKVGIAVTQVDVNPIILG